MDKILRRHYSKQGDFKAARFEGLVIRCQKDSVFKNIKDLTAENNSILLNEKIFKTDQKV